MSTTIFLHDSQMTLTQEQDLYVLESQGDDELFIKMVFTSHGIEELASAIAAFRGAPKGFKPE